MDLLIFLDRFSPLLCRAMARRQGNRLTVQEIATTSGLSVRTVIRLSKLKSWAGIRVGVVVKYMLACGVDPFHTKHIREYIRATGGEMPHIKNARVRKYITKLAAS